MQTTQETRFLLWWVSIATEGQRKKDLMWRGHSSVRAKQCKVKGTIKANSKEGAVE